MDSDNKAPSVPYVSFRTFLNFLERMEPEPPPRIDKSVVAYLSGGYASQLLSGLRAMQLIDADGLPSSTLTDLVVTPSRRGELIRYLWQNVVYRDLWNQIDVAKATSAQLEEAFGSYGVSGETKKKAIVFFVHGAQFADIPLSTHILKNLRRSPSTARRPSRKPRSAQALEQGAAPASMPPPGGAGVQVPIHAMLAGAIQWLAENGPTWTQEQADNWCETFVRQVGLVYPPKPHAANGHKREFGEEAAGVRTGNS